MDVQSKVQINAPETCLELLESLDAETLVNPRFKVPFEFDVLDTPNKAIAVAVTKLALGAQTFNKAQGGNFGKDERVAMVEKAKSLVDEGTATLPKIEDALVPPIIRDGCAHIINTMLLLVQVHRGPQPPATLQPDQYIERRKLLIQLYNEASSVKTNARWRDTVIGWCKKQTMRTVAHHLAAVLKTEMDRLTNPNYKGAVCTTETVAKRLCEILTLLEACGHMHDAVFMSTRKDFDAGYRLSLPPGYKPFLVTQISTGELFTIKN